MRVAAGNENERRHLLPLLDALATRGIKPNELWADRGYASAELEQQLRERGITPRISQPRRRGQPIPPGTPTTTVWRGKKQVTKTRDPQGRHRWPVERTTGWIRSPHRITIRRDRNPAIYEAFLQLTMILILTRLF